MKTQVIQLDLHDDLVSIRDRMDWAKTPRILLVWPKHGKVDVRPLDLTLLRRHTESVGAELGLVTRSGEIRAAARGLHITVFSTAADAQKKKWLGRRTTRPVRRFPRVDLRSLRRSLPGIPLLNFAANPVRRVAVFSLGVIAVLVIILVFIPSAEIQLTLPEQEQSLTIVVSSEPDRQDVQISGLVPARRLTITLGGAGSALPTGSLVLPAEPARGQARLENLTTRVVNVPSGTLLQTASDPPLVFLTESKTELPAGKGKTATVAIRAAVPGPAGNLAPGLLAQVEGPLALQIKVTNPGPVSGGTQTATPLATEQDRTSLRKRLLADLQRQALGMFASQVSPGNVLFPVTLNPTRIVEESYDPPAGEAGEKLKLTLRVDFAVDYSSQADLQLLARRVLDASLPAGYSASTGDASLQPVSDFAAGEDAVHWQMRAVRKMRPTLEADQVIALVQGKTVNKASGLLKDSLGLAQIPTIRLRPDWWPWLPFLPIRIAVSS